MVYLDNPKRRSKGQPSDYTSANIYGFGAASTPPCQLQRHLETRQSVREQSIEVETERAVREECDAAPVERNRMFSEMVMETLAQLHFAGPVFRRRIPEVHAIDDIGVGDDGPFAALGVPLHSESATTNPRRLFANRSDRPTLAATYFEAETT
jgi:hypothetical protein